MESQKINRLKVVLVENGKTGKWLAEQVGKNEATVSRWCSNKMQPSLDMLVKIANLFKVSTDRILGLDEKKYLEITGLDDNQLAHIQAIINDIAKL